MIIHIKMKKINIFFGLVLLLVVIGLIGNYIMAGAQVVPQPIEQIITEQKVIGLTVNVDWGEEFLPGMLAELEKYNAKATFFVTGRWAKHHPDLVKLIAEKGHQVENHGYSHPHPDRLSVESNKDEIKKTEEIIEEIIGKKTTLYAPPYGERGITGLKAAHELGYKTILWTLDTVDWRSDSTPQVIAQRVINPAERHGVKPEKRGAIVLMHPKENTLKALPVILEHLTKEGFQMLPLGDMITLEQTGNTTS